MTTATRTITVSAVLVLGFAAWAQAQPYSPPPTWSPMSMLNVTFNTTTQRLDVVDEAVKLGAGVYAVLALDTNSNPAVTSTYGKPNFTATAGGSFDLNQPWKVLDHTAFSRQLGWNPGGTITTDIPAVYGAAASIWMECLSATPGLSFYKAVGKWGVSSAGTLDANSVPNIDPNAHGYDPIFGTAGSSTKWQWDYMMDHNVCAVPSSYLTSPNQLFIATYKVYVGDSLGNEILNGDGSSASSIETWTWQGPANVPEPATLTLLAGGAMLTLLRRRKGPARRPAEPACASGECLRRPPSGSRRAALCGV